MQILCKGKESPSEEYLFWFFLKKNVFCTTFNFLNLHCNNDGEFDSKEIEDSPQIRPTPGKCLDASTIRTGLPYISRKSCT